MQQANYLIHPETAVKFLLGLLLSTFLTLAVLIPKHNSIYHKSDRSNETVFAIDSADQIKINRTANELLEKGDSVSGYLLKRVLMSQQ